MTEDRGLTEALQRRADQLGTTHPLSLEDVQGRARGIRRRRTALSGLAAAAVLAVAAPIGLTIGDDATPDRSTPVASTGVKDGVLTIEVDADSGGPGLPYLYDGEIHLPDGGTVPVAGDWSGFAPLEEGFVVTDGTTLQLLTADGEVTVEAPVSDASFAVSPDRSLVAFLGDRSVEWIAADGSSGAGISVPPQIETPQLVGVQGADSCDPDSEGGGCVFYLNDAGTDPGAYTLTSKGIMNLLSGFLFLSGVSDDGFVSGVTHLDEAEPGTCSEVWDHAFGDGPLWDTCDVRPTTFSPESTRVIGAPEYGDGFGDSSLAILDASDGTVLAEWVNSEEHQAAITSTTWDEDGSVLGLVREGNDWALMRFAEDGGLSKVTDLQSDDPETAPVVFPGGS